MANFEFYYHAHGVDVGFDPEFVSIFSDPGRLRAQRHQSARVLSRRLGSLRDRVAAQPVSARDAPADQHVHEGVDTDIARPQRTASFSVPGLRRALTHRDQVVTYVARNLEPYRGFHIFMRALPQLLRRCPRARVVIVGGAGVSYSAPPAPRTTFRDMMLRELGAKLDLERVHFLGMIDYVDYLRLLQVSSAHVYLTYPFVLSWSFIEAMASGCLIVASATPPVLEVLRDGENGFAVDCQPSLAAR